MFNDICIRENLLPKYSDINIHDQAIQHEDFVTDFRKRLTTEQLSRKKELLKKQSDEVLRHRAAFDDLCIDDELKRKIHDSLSAILRDHDELARNRVLKKLTHLYKGDIAVPENDQGFLNLSSTQLTPDQEEFLNLGINCHNFPKFNAVTKKTEVAVLFEDLIRLKEDGKVDLNAELQSKLQAEEC